MEPAAYLSSGYGGDHLPGEGAGIVMRLKPQKQPRTQVDFDPAAKADDGPDLPCLSKGHELDERLGGGLFPGSPIILDAGAACQKWANTGSLGSEMKNEVVIDDVRIAGKLRIACPSGHLQIVPSIRVSNFPAKPVIYIVSGNRAQGDAGFKPDRSLPPRVRGGHIFIKSVTAGDPGFPLLLPESRHCE